MRKEVNEKKSNSDIKLNPLSKSTILNGINESDNSNLNINSQRKTSGLKVSNGNNMNTSKSIYPSNISINKSKNNDLNKNNNQNENKSIVTDAKMLNNIINNFHPKKTKRISFDMDKSAEDLKLLFIKTLKNSNLANKQLENQRIEQKKKNEM